MNDLILKEVAEIAKESFQKCFGERQKLAIEKCMDVLIEEIGNTLKKEIGEMMEQNSNLDEQLAISILDRLQISTINTIFYCHSLTQ